MLTVWGRKNSGNVQKAMWAIGELGLACRRIDAGGPFGKNREPAYLAANPNGLVPTLDDDGFVLWESNAIVRYLAARYGAGRLEPADLRARATVDQWMDWQLSVMAPAQMPVFIGLLRTPPEQRDHGAIAAATAKMTDAFAILDAQLAKASYVAGDSFTGADIALGIMAHRYVFLVPNRPATPALDRWYAALGERAAFREHVGDVPIT